MKISKYVWEGRGAGGSSEVTERRAKTHQSAIPRRHGDADELKLRRFRARQRTIHHSEPRRVVRVSDGVSCQASVLPGVVQTYVPESQNLHVFVRGVHICGLGKRKKRHENELQMKSMCVGGCVHLKDNAAVTPNKSHLKTSSKNILACHLILSDLFPVLWPKM